MENTFYKKKHGGVFFSREQHVSQLKALLIVTICQKLSSGKISGRIVPKFERKTFCMGFKKRKIVGFRGNQKKKKKTGET